MYSPPLPEDLQYQSSWEYRCDLLKQRLKLIGADVVCFQEVSPNTFEQDFEFMHELGYDGVELFKKGRFRPATFWRKSHCDLAAPAVHKDRSLLTSFRLVDRPSNTPAKNWYVLNCHLQAGRQAQRRVRQINEGVRGVMTLARKLNEVKPEESLRLVVCGDFNGGQECGAVQYLEQGFIDETWIEDGDPVSSGRKEMPLAKPMIDVTTSVEDRAPPPTLVVPELISSMMAVGTDDSPELSQDMVERLGRIHANLSSDNINMSYEDVERWLVLINKQVGRGDEYREAARQMGWKDPNPKTSFENQKARIELPKAGVLSLEGFVEVYRKELRAGKFWGVAHDMAVLGDPLPDIGVFTGRYDRMYHSQSITPTAVLDTTSEVACPNANEPSDHLPVAASFKAL